MIREEKKTLFFKNKRGEEGIIYPVVIFVILNLIFISSLLIFVDRSSRGTAIYEQAYAKQIVLLINGAQAGTEIILDFEKAIEIAEKNEIYSKKELVQNSNNEISVILSKKGGYSYKFFSNKNVELDFVEDNLIIKIKN